VATSPTSGPGGAAFDGGTITQPVTVDDGAGNIATLFSGGVEAIDAAGSTAQCVAGDTITEGVSVQAAGSAVVYQANALGVIIGLVAAPADGDIGPSQCALWLDDTPAATKLMVKAKDSGGTVRSAAIALS
jgi:hypothetical protein